MRDMDSYVARINGVLNHIDVHLGENIDLSRLAEVACFSKRQMARTGGYYSSYHSMGK